MALIAVSGHPGCRFEEVARITAQRLKFELLTQSRIQPLIAAKSSAPTARFRQGVPEPGDIDPGAARDGASHRLLRARRRTAGAAFSGMLRAHVVAPENVRIGNLMIDGRLDRAAARQQLQELEAAERADRKAKFGKTKATADLFDLVLNAEIADFRADGGADRDGGGSRRGCGNAGISRRRPRRSFSSRCG